ncbi:MAG: hypothetical protein JXB62_05145 [Pirellulales bacterium]|nr:hypothetical protein [Pirellulales bacterium]
MASKRRLQIPARDILAILSWLVMFGCCVLFCVHFEFEALHDANQSPDDCPICLWGMSLGTIGLCVGWVVLVSLATWIVSAPLSTPHFLSSQLLVSARSPPRAL